MRLDLRRVTWRRVVDINDRQLRQIITGAGGPANGFPMEGGFDITPHHMAPNGFLHAGSLVTLADSLCGMACAAALPDTASGFTTIELKSNFFSTAREGRVEGVARPVHLGGTTH